MAQYVSNEPMKGDVIKVRRAEFIENVPGNDYQNKFHYRGTRFIVVSTMPSNNGNFLAKDARGRQFWFNWLTEEITILKRANH